MAPGTKSDQTRIQFVTELVRVETSTLLQLPEPASRQLPSRGQVAVEGSIDGHPLATVVEPDGRGGHWVRVDDAVRRTTGLDVGDSTEVTLEVTRTWPEPDVPEDLATALGGASTKVQEAWGDITPMARWEWVRWVQATKSDDTRRRRVDVSISKLDNGKRRPCCFDLSSCTDQSVSKSGKLISPSESSAS
jgi:Domain of unknown function (DUF1905)/Bacteriocin-protection, YdeI or OmpD-Associated